MSQSTALLESPSSASAGNAPVSTLQEILAPLSEDEFFSRFWEKNYLHLRGGSESRFQSLFSIGDVDRWLKSIRDTASDALLLTPPAGATDVSEKVTARAEEAEISGVYHRLAEGWSVVLNHMHSNWPPLRSLVEGLGATFGCDIGVNAYLTPQGSQTFNVHVDSHDVFVLQISGEKLWRIHEMTELTAVHLSSRDHLNFPSTWSQPGESPLLEELTLKAGEVLFIPRGMPHCAIARDDTSLHLTISINPLCWQDFLKVAIEQASLTALPLRRALPPRFVDNESTHKAMANDFQRALEAFMENLDFETALKALRRARIHDHGFPRDGHLQEIDALRHLSLETELEKRPGILCMVEKQEGYGTVSIRFGTEHIRSKIGLFEVFDFMRRTPRFLVSDLPRLDDKGRLILARRMIRAGLLRRVGGAG